MDMVLLEPPTDFTLREVSTLPERSFGSSSKCATEAPESREIAELEERGLGNGVLRGVGVLAIAGIVGSGIYSVIKQYKAPEQAPA